MDTYGREQLISVFNSQGEAAEVPLYSHYLNPEGQRVYQLLDVSALQEHGRVTHIIMGYDEVGRKMINEWLEEMGRSPIPKQNDMGDVVIAPRRAATFSALSEELVEVARIVGGTAINYKEYTA